MFPPTDSAKNAVDMFPTTDKSKDIHSILSSQTVKGNISIVKRHSIYYIDKKFCSRNYEFRLVFNK